MHAVPGEGGLRILARESGAVVRQRKVDIVALFWTLVLGREPYAGRFCDGSMNGASGQRIEESSFYDRLNAGSVALLKAALERAFGALADIPRALIDRHWDGIAAYCKPDNKVSLGFIEGLNNRIRVYLKLTILACMLLPVLSNASESPTRIREEPLFLYASDNLPPAKRNEYLRHCALGRVGTFERFWCRIGTAT